MEDIIGFEDQIGVPFFSVFNRAIKKPLQAATMKAKTNLATQEAKANLAKRMLQQRNTMIAQRIAKGLPIPANIKNAILKNAKTGKPLPNIIKQGLLIAKQKKLVVPIALPKRTIAQQIERAKVVAQKKGITFKRTIAQLMQRAKAAAQQKGILPISTLTRVTNPMLVKQATPIQKSFMPVDLPYRNFAPKTRPLKILATNYSLPTSIDLVEPNIDAGTNNYYGK